MRNTKWAAFVLVALTTIHVQASEVPTPPVREQTVAGTRQGTQIQLVLKRYARPGAVPLLLVLGLAENDRIYDSPIREANFAYDLYEQGFDVWIGNARGAGTEGFRSEKPAGPHHWTVEDYAVFDLPALVDKVRGDTGQSPFLIGHSLGAWIIEGYLAGLDFTARGEPVPRLSRGLARQTQIRGVVSIAGVYNLWWSKPLAEALTNPIRTENDFYQSNYELELAARSPALMTIVSRLPALPLGWIGDILHLPAHKIPYIGATLAAAYRGVQLGAIETPLLNMFYNAENSDPEMVLAHGRDGLEDLGPKLMEQLANSIHVRSTVSHYEFGGDARGAYHYSTIRPFVKVPMLFIAGGRDRLANAAMIREEGFERTRTRDKQYLEIENAGHLDILSGRNARARVRLPIARWLKKR